MVSLGALIYTLPYILGLFYRDIEIVDDAELALKTVPVVQEENAHFDLRTLPDVPVGQGDYYGADELQELLAGEKWNEELATQILSDNQEVLTIMEAASGRPAYQEPALSDPAAIGYQMELVSVGNWRTGGDIVLLQALNEARSGNIPGALNSIRWVEGIVEKVNVSQLSVVHYLAGLHLRTKVLQTLETILTEVPLSQAEANQLRALLSVEYGDEVALTTVIQGEYAVQKSVVDGIQRGDAELLGQREGDLVPKTSFYFQPNRTKQLFAELAKQQIAMVTRSCQSSFLESSPERLMPENLLLLYVTPNASGIVMHDVVAGAIGASLKTKVCELEAREALLDAALAIAVYQNETKETLPNLAALIPDYLEAIPQDPFSGRDIIFAPEISRLYSVGENKRDDGGVDDREDVVVRIPSSIEE